MSDPKNNIDLKDIWKKEAIKVDLPSPRSTKNIKKKKKGKEVISTSTSRGKPIVDLDPPQLEVQHVERVVSSTVEAHIHTPATHTPTAHTPAPSSTTAGPESIKVRHQEDSSAPNANLKRQREIVQERLKDKGIVPSISDLEASKRVGTYGPDLYHELTDLLAGELNKWLQGKISALDIENKYLEGKLFRAQAELNAYWEQTFLSFSEDNQALKEELEQLKGMKGALEAANSKVAEQEKLLERLPQAEKELEDAPQWAADVEAKEEGLKTRVAELTKVDTEHRKQLATVSVEGFKMALGIITVLAPEINFKYFDDSYVTRDGKLYEGNRVAYDSAVDGVSKAEDKEETETPANPDAAGAGRTETGTA